MICFIVDTWRAFLHCEWVYSQVDSQGWFCSGSGLNGFSPRWATKWILRFEAWLNDLLHSGAFPSHCEKESWIQVLLFFLLNSSFCACLGVKTQCLFCCCWIGALWTPVYGFSPVWVSMWVLRFSAKIEGFYILHNAILPWIRHKMSSHRSSLGGWIATVLTLVQLFLDVDTKVHF